MNIILCGLPASGKSFVGKVVSKKLNLHFFDTDALIESAGISCRQLYRDHGEEYFRVVEKNVIMGLKTAKKSVIATGGGTFEDIENRNFFRSIGCVIYLQANVEVLWKRLLERGIGAFLPRESPQEAFYSIAKKRIPLYEKAAHITINTDIFDLETLTAEVCKEYGK